MRARPLALLLALSAGCAGATAAGPGPHGAAPAADAAALDARCARGFAADCRALARVRLLGDGAPRDDRLGAALATRACEMGDPAACGDLGVLYALGRALPQSDARAAALSRRACEAGAALACSNQGALLVEGAGVDPGVPGRADEPPGLRAVRLFRTACEAGVPEGCLNLATAMEAGRLATRDLPGAGRAYRSACASGLALGCHRLALLVAERPEVAPDLSAAALEARACGAGVVPACLASNEKPPPPEPRTPGSRLVEDRGSFALGITGAGGFHPGDLAAVAGGPKRTLEEARRPPASLQAAVPPALRVRLGVNGAARPDGPADPAVELLVETRRALLGQCYASPRAVPGPVEVDAVFLVDGDGHVADAKAAALPADAELEACLLEQIAAWEFPVAADGLSGPYLVRYAFEPAPPGPAPALAGPGWLRPALRDPECVERALEVPPEYRTANVSATVRVAVDGAGAPRLVHPLAPLPEPVLAAVVAAVGRCEWAPGADASGRPAPIWTTLTVRLGQTSR
ncbi:tetratricopeptide repeat protein [Anaeromyxobacter oryzae]|uniref:Beta-lactamase n=1 Tax=Anaeromyxobacter oryzae TaxID=2918170 RepID=A0ABM7WWQ0_9BACT|nr:tetratricopeptide repeat protein [Anaeromyxobacter oryzae]BDG03919.1 hypothetical protein AMOR_29150 [Anaeromyxobacter oryzae]